MYLINSDKKRYKVDEKSPNFKVLQCFKKGGTREKVEEANSANRSFTSLGDKGGIKGTGPVMRFRELYDQRDS